MSKLLLTSDLHLGHKNVHRFRTQFSSAEEHHEVIFDNLASNVSKRDSVIFLGDVAFTEEWNEKIGTIQCAKKTLILGNHDCENLNIKDLVKVYDDIHGLWSKGPCWLSHCPIIKQEMRHKLLNIHGHLHFNNVWKNEEPEGFVFREGGPAFLDEIDPLYFNVCLEHTDYKPIDFQDIRDITGV